MRCIFALDIISPWEISELPPASGRLALGRFRHPSRWHMRRAFPWLLAMPWHGWPGALGRADPRSSATRPPSFSPQSVAGQRTASLGQTHENVELWLVAKEPHPFEKAYGYVRQYY
jgi:hypothetical protein